MFNRLRFLGQDNNSNGVATSNVAANADGTILERLEFIQAGQSGTAGIPTYPAAAAAGNGVSMAEVLRYIEDILAGTAGVVTYPAAAAYGNGVSLAEVLAYCQDAILAAPRSCEKSDGAVLSGDDDLFTISGGPIKVVEITGIVTTTIGAGTTNVKLTLTTTTPAATVDMNAAAVDIDADAAGTSYQSINTTAIFTPVTAGFVKEANAFATQPTQFLCPIGTIKLNSSAARAGVIKWYLRYVPLSPSSRVVAAA